VTADLVLPGRLVPTRTAISSSSGEEAWSAATSGASAADAGFDGSGTLGAMSKTVAARPHDRKRDDRSRAPPDMIRNMIGEARYRFSSSYSSLAASQQD
jgi:hypothetical protein